MRQRSISAIGVVVVGIVPALMGGPALAIVFTLLCLIGIFEFNAMAGKIGKRIMPTGYVAVTVFGIVAFVDDSDLALFGAAAIAVFLPLVWAIFRDDLEGAFIDWALITAGSLYLGIPLYAAISLRSMDGTIDAEWLDGLSSALALGWDHQPRGLAWLLLCIVVTWLSDTGAYLIGRSMGRRPLIPRISPKKTVEGLAGGLIAAALTGAIAGSVFGLGLPIWAGLLIGLVIGAVGVVGDLAESLMKRQVSVKDSGGLIPGHGGMLDRLDALLFTWTAGLLIASLADRAL